MRNISVGAIGILVLLLFSQNSVQAQSSFDTSQPDSVFWSDMKYRAVGPSRGGRVTAVEGVSSKPFTFYMGATGGGVWETFDAGESWHNISDGYFKAGSIGSIEVAEADPNVIYVGTGSDAPRGNISPGIGVYKSLDAGKSWHHIGLDKGGQIGEIVTHPKNADLVYAAVLGNIFGPNKERGIYRSKDGGKNWENILFVSDSTGAIDINIDPSNPRILYAGFWRAERKPWTLIDGSTEGGVFKSVDGGDNWHRVKGGLPDKGLLGKVDIAISPANPDRIWVMQQAKKEEAGGLYRSDDGGQSWKRTNGEHKLRQRQSYYTHLIADPKNENTVYVLNTGFYKSTDGGKTFESISVPHGDVHGLWLNPDNPAIMLNSNDGGANITLDGGKTWSTQLNQPTAEFYRLEVDNQFPYRVYGAQQDNSTISVPSKYPGDIAPLEYWYTVGGGESGHVAVDPQNPDIIYAGTYSGEITRANLKTGRTLQLTPYPHYTEGTNMMDLKYRFQWNYPILISKHHPDTIYIGSQYVHRSTDGGMNWEVISPDLSTNNPKYLNRIPGGPILHDATGVEVYSSIFVLEESPLKEGELWAGSDDGRVHISKDAGESWQEITPANMPEGATVNAIDISVHTPGTAYMAAYKYRESDFKPYIFKTEDYGGNWQLLTNGNGIPEDSFVRVVREDPNRRGLLYAGTEFGMYISFDDGARWQPFQQNLPYTPVTDIKIHDQDLVLSTQGRSFWIMDDLTPLHQLNGEVSRSDYHLYKPRTAWRTQLGGYGSDPTPDPYPTGALVNFYIQEVDTQQTVMLEILDKEGTLVQRFSTEDTLETHKLTVHSGLNRFEWDLTYPGPFTVEDLVSMVMRNPARGPEAVPGTYQVRLTVGDQSETESFELKADPRWDVANKQLQETFDLSMQVADMITTFQHAIKNIRSMRDQISSIVKGSVRNGNHQEIVQQTDQIKARLTALENEFINNNIESGQDAIGMERRLSNRMGRLYMVLRDHDAEPTGGMRERFTDLTKVYQGYMERYEQIVNSEVASFNTFLEEHQVEHIFIGEL